MFRVFIFILALIFQTLLLGSISLWANPSSVYENYRGEKAYEAKQYDQAREHFSQGLVEDSENYRAAYNLGNSFYRMGDFEKAQESYQKATGAFDSKLKEQAFYNLGNSQYRLGQLEDAIQSYGTALNLNPDNAQAKLNLEFVKRKLQEKQQKEKSRSSTESSSSSESSNSSSGSSESENSTESSPSNTENNATSSPKPSDSDTSKNHDKSGEKSSDQNSPSSENSSSTTQGSTSPKEESKKDRTEKALNENPLEDSQKDGGQGAVNSEKRLGRKTAEQWLNALDEDPSAILKNQIQKKMGVSRKMPKDW